VLSGASVPQRPTKSPRWTLFAMCFALFMIMLDATIVNVALPSIQRALHTTPETLQWTIDAYVLTYAALILFGGKLGDRFGRRRMFLAGLVVFTLASAACALATTDTQLVAFRAVQGTGAALLSPLSLSILAAAFPRRQLPTAIGIWAGISGIGLSAGPVVGGLLVERVSWSAIFWVNVPVGLIAAAVCLWAVAESRDERSHHLDIVGTGLVTAGLFALVLALIGTTSQPWASARTLGLLAAAGLLVALFLVWERHNSDPMIPLRLFRRPAFSTSSVVALLVGFAFIGVLYLIVLYLQNVEGYSPLQAGVRTLPLTLTQALIAANAGRLDRRLGTRAKMSGGMIVLSAGLLGLAQVHVASAYAAIWPFEVMLGLGIGLVLPAVSAAAMAAADRNQSGIASGVINASRQVGGALGIAVMGSIAAALARNGWDHRLSQLPLTTHATATRLTALVVDGQGKLIAALAGHEAQAAAFDSFVHGLHGALLTSSALTLIGSVVAVIGLRQQKPDSPSSRGVHLDKGRAATKHKPHDREHDDASGPHSPSRPNGASQGQRSVPAGRR
jgi:EmrB/QacA subfamily drug resistance transporter